LFNQKDELGIILCGTEENDNHLDFENISMLRTLDPPSLSLFNDLDKLVTSEETAGDLFDSIELAIDFFIKKYGKRKWNKRIFILSDGEGGKISLKRASSLANMLRGNDVKVNFIAIDFFREIENDGEEEDSMSETIKETPNQQAVKAAFKQLAEEEKNVKIFTATQAEHIYQQFRKKKVSPVVKFRGPLILTNNTKINVWGYAKTAKVNIPSLKKQSLAAESSQSVERGGLVNERIYVAPEDTDQTPITEDNRAKAYYYGKSLAPVSKTDEIGFKNLEERCLRAIGFTDNFRVPRHHYMSTSDVIIPDPTSEIEMRAFHALVTEMITMNKVLICRYVYRTNSEPKLVVLYPKISKTHGSLLYLNSLPTVEDMRDYQFESLKESTTNQQKVIGEFIKSLSLEREEEDGEVEEVLKPSETFNPVLQYFYQCLEHKSLEKESNLPPLDEAIGAYLKPDKKMFENNKFVTFLPKMFEIKEKEVKADEKKRRVFWREMIKSEIGENISEKKLEEKLSDKKPEDKKEISPNRPIEDFKEMVGNKYIDLTVDAMKQLKDIIVKFITESFKGSYYIKAIECIKALRDTAIDDDEFLFFNGFLEDLKSSFPRDKFSDFWKLFYENRISLISSRENVKCPVTSSEAETWLESINKKEVVSSTLEDLNDLMEGID
jgi:ATP-dependent DNA helicase 2 subunit 2